MRQGARARRALRACCCACGGGGQSGRLGRRFHAVWPPPPPPPPQSGKGLAYLVNYGPGTPAPTNVHDCQVTSYDSAAYPACTDGFGAAAADIPPLGDYVTMVTDFNENLCGPTVPGSYICTYNATVGAPCPGFEIQVARPSPPLTLRARTCSHCALISHVGAALGTVFVGADRAIDRACEVLRNGALQRFWRLHDMCEPGAASRLV